MEKRPDTRSWLNPRPSWSAETQRERLTGEVYEVTGKEKDHGEAKRTALIRSVRKGTIVEVCELFLLALDVGRSDRQRRDLLEAVDKIEAHGGVVIELATGFRSDVPRQWRQMQAEAFYRLGRAVKGRRSAANGAASKGRPIKFDLTPEQHKAVDAIQHDRRYTNDDDRMDEIRRVTGLPLKRGWVRRHFGSPHGTPAKSVRSGLSDPVTSMR